MSKSQLLIAAALLVGTVGAATTQAARQSSPHVYTDNLPVNRVVSPGPFTTLQSRTITLDTDRMVRVFSQQVFSRFGIASVALGLSVNGERVATSYSVDNTPQDWLNTVTVTRTVRLPKGTHRIDVATQVGADVHFRADADGTHSCGYTQIEIE